MTATALAYNPAFDPQLDMFDDGDALVPARPQLRLIEGGGYGTVASALAPADIEIYRRRRFLALVTATLLVLGLAWAAGISVLSFGGDASVAAAANSEAPAVHVVLPGDSYGAIAADLGVANPAMAADVLRAANGGAELIVGQRLVIDVASLSAG